MAVSNFDIAQNLKVEMYLPNEADNLFIIGVSAIGGNDVLAANGYFVIGYSLIGGEDVLGDTNAYQFSWQSVEAEVSKIDIQLGGGQTGGIQYTAEPSNCNFELQSWTFDPNNNSSVRNGTQFRVRLVATGVDQVLFTGYIENMNIAYRPDAPNLIKGTALDAYKRFANTRATYNHVGTSKTVTDILALLAANAGLTVSGSNDPGVIPMAGQQQTAQTAGNIVKELLDTQLGLLWLNPVTQAIEYRDRTTTVATPTYTVGNNHSDANHWCMSGLAVNQNPDDLVNSIKATMTSDTTKTLLRENTDSIQLYGIQSQNSNVNASAEAYLSTWMDLAFIERPKQLVKEVTTPTINRLGTLTDAATITPGTPIGVKYQTSNINIDQKYQVTRVKHSIDPNNWSTTLELWRAS
jgi:hypothetical protein